ncbi:MAG: peroxiredoxin 2/4 [Candidatus Dependentiae bacterium]|nr:peroxiredoxin 2/4 [Candidatus Dependentiae bacterium]
MNSIGKRIAPFRVKAITGGTIRTMSDSDLLGSYTVLFFYPLDFTFVCPTEIHALQEKMSEFGARDVRIYAISVDSIHAHRAWLEMPKERGGIAGVTFTLISDINRQLALAFNVLNDEESVALRGTFILDKENVLQYASINNLSFGRSIDEIIRVVDAISFIEKHGNQACPANWSAGKKTMNQSAEGVIEYFTPSK